MAVHSREAEPQQAAPAMADTAPKKRGRPKGSFAPRVQTCKFSINDAVDRFTELATIGDHPEWSWDGRMYPKGNRRSGPNRKSLENHGLVLKILFQLAPNGYPDQYRLRDVVLNLHHIFNILANPPEEEKCLPLSKRALLAADRWRIMCKHALMIKSCKTKVDSPTLE